MDAMMLSDMGVLRAPHQAQSGRAFSARTHMICSWVGERARARTEERAAIEVVFGLIGNQMA